MARAGLTAAVVERRKTAPWSRVREANSIPGVSSGLGKDSVTATEMFHAFVNPSGD